jgi:hypothetical protein
MAKFTTHDLEEILGAALTGMTVDEFKAEVQTWLTTAKHPRWNRPNTELAYQPMLEVLQYLRVNGYKTYIVTGGGQDFARMGFEKVYGIPPENVVGTTRRTRVCLWTGPGTSRHEGWHVYSGALRQSEEGRLDGDQYEERLEAHICIRVGSKSGH